MNSSKTRKSVDGEPSHIPALNKANRIEASYSIFQHCSLNYPCKSKHINVL